MSPTDVLQYAQYDVMINSVEGLSTKEPENIVSSLGPPLQLYKDQNPDGRGEALY